MKYVADTYALIEWYLRGNPRYEGYFQEKNYVTTLTLLEFYHLTYHRTDKETADAFYLHITRDNETVHLDHDTIKAAGILKEKKKLSYTDSVNYITSKTKKTRLLTGDEDFRNLREDIEFIK